MEPVRSPAGSQTLPGDPQEPVRHAKQLGRPRGVHRRQADQPDHVPLLPPQAGHQQVERQGIERCLSKAVGGFISIGAPALPDGEEQGPYQGSYYMPSIILISMSNFDGISLPHLTN